MGGKPKRIPSSSGNEAAPTGRFARPSDDRTRLASTCTAAPPCHGGRSMSRRGPETRPPRHGRRRPPSTTHMRYPPSSGILLILPDSLSIPPRPYPVGIAAKRCVKDTSAACLGDEAGVKSRSPHKRVREAQDLRPASSPKHNRACRSAAIGPAPAWSFAPPVVQAHVPTRASCGVVPDQLISGRRSQRLHQEPPYAGQRAGQSGPFCSCGLFQPVVDAVPCPGLRRADQARPNLVVSVIAWRGAPPSAAAPAGSACDANRVIPSARRLQAPRRRSRSATAPRATCEPRQQSRCASPACSAPPPWC